MPITAAENQANLDDVAQAAAESLGLDGIAKSDWSQNDRLDYIDTFKTMVLARPDNFLPATVAVAQHIDTTGLELQSWLSIQWDANNAGLDAALNVAGQLATNAGNVGTGVIDAVGAISTALHGAADSVSVIGKIAPYIIPVAAVLFLYMATRSASNRIANKSWLK